MQEDSMTGIDLSNLSPEMSAPPAGAKGCFAFQPSTGRIWNKLDGEWLPIKEAHSRICQKRGR